VSDDDATLILRQPGRLVVSPTNLATAFPHGGTSLGFTEDGIILRPNIGLFPLRARDFGSETYEWLYTGCSIEAECELPQWDNDSLQRAFPGGLTAAGATSANRVIQYPGTLAQGSLIGEAAAVSLLFSPEDLTEDKVVLARRALIALQTDAEQMFKRQANTTLQLMIGFIRDPNHATDATKTMQVGDRRDITI